MSYQKYEATEWKDEPNEETTIDAEKLNNIENGIKNLESKVLEKKDIVVEDSLESNSTTNAPSVHAVTQIEEFQLDMSNTKCGNVYVNKLRLQNRLVIFDFEGVVANLPNGYSLIGKIPTEILPMESGYYSDILMYFPIILSGMNRIAFGRILKNGNVEVYSDTIAASQTGYIPENSYIRIHESWFIN